MRPSKRKIPDWALHGLNDAESEADQSAFKTDDIEPGRKAAKIDDDAEEEDDYFSMALDHLPEHHSSLLSRHEKKRILRQESGRPIPKAAAESTNAVSARSATSEAPVEPISKAMRMMQKMGYVSGQALGVDNKGIIEPLEARQHDRRKGLGIEAQQAEESLKQVEAAAQKAKKTEEEQLQYRDTVRSEAREKQIERQIHAAQKVCETLDTRAIDDDDETKKAILARKQQKPAPKEVNVLWRSLVKAREEKERARALRQSMLDASVTFSSREYNDDDPHLTFPEAQSASRKNILEQDGGDEWDEELATFEAKDSEERLNQVLDYLRTTYNYCFWCGCQYTDQNDMVQSCPGLNESDHD